MTNEGRTSRRIKAPEGTWPPNPKQWEVEKAGFLLRRRLSLAPTDRLSVNEVFRTLPHVRVSKLGDIPCSAETLNRLIGADWISGAAIPMPDGSVQVLYNEGHSDERARATLMEEYFHIRFGHAPSVITLLEDEARRSHDALLEAEAYGSGAAALLPFAGLKAFMKAGRGTPEIAAHFQVSHGLVAFRAKVCKQFRKLERLDEAVAET